MEVTPLDITHGHLLGGRLRYTQPRDGYRTGLEPVLLAASVPAKPGQLVLEAGTGAGAGLLCLVARMPGVRGVGVEIDPAMAELARGNLRDNEFAGIDIVTADICNVGDIGRFDHAFANPPWHDPRSTSSPVQRRRLAKQASGDGLERWVEAISRILVKGGSLTMILPASQRARAHALGLTSVRALPPKQGRAPKLLIAQAWPGADRAPFDIVTVLHEADGAFTPDIDAILRGGAGFRSTAA